MNIRDRMKELGGEDGLRFYENGKRIEQEFSDSFTNLFEDAIENKGDSGEQVMAAWLSALAQEYAVAIVSHYSEVARPMGMEMQHSVSIGMRCLVSHLNEKFATLAAQDAGVEGQIKAAAKRGAEA